MTFSMTPRMVAWTGHRQHAWNVCFEMAAAMVAPAIPFCALRMADVISRGICAAYCGLSVVAMLSVMVYRRDYFSHKPLEAQL